jgi:flagellar basal-body rod protein FlgB
VDRAGVDGTGFPVGRTPFGEEAVDLLARDVTFAALAKAQSASSERTRLLAQNIANVNTPGYKRHDIDFQGELAQALDDHSGNGESRVARVLDTTAREIVENDQFFRVDGGGVDIDREMAEFAKNNLYGSAMSSFLQDKLRMYKMVVRGGR